MTESRGEMYRNISFPPNCARNVLPLAWAKQSPATNLTRVPPTLPPSSLAPNKAIESNRNRRYGRVVERNRTILLRLHSANFCPLPEIWRGADMVNATRCTTHAANGYLVR